MVVFEIQGLPLQQPTVGSFARARGRAIERDVCGAQTRGQLGYLAGMSGPADQARPCSFFQAVIVRSEGLLGIRRDDFEILSFTKREKRITGPAAWMNTAERRANSKLFFDESDTAVEIAAAEENMVEHFRRVILSQRECWRNESDAS